ncbi:hypothetical protein [Halobellus limi]|nr:hypothetical protein [Halobellus limi]
MSPSARFATIREDLTAGRDARCVALASYRRYSCGETTCSSV